MATTPYNIDRTTGTSYGTSPANQPGAGEQAFRDRRARAAGVVAANGVLDFNNFDPTADLFKTIPPTNPGAPSGGGGGGGGGRGGGRGGGGVSSAQANAYRALLGSMTGSNGVDDAWAAYIRSMQGVYDPAKAAAKWDTAGGDIRNAGAQGRERLSGIYDQLVARAATGRQGVADAVSQGDTALQGIAARFGAASQAGADNINNVLSNFDAGRMDPGVYQNELNSLAMAGQIGNQRMGTAYDVAFADRPQVYAGLNSDISSGMTAQEQAMLNQIAARKAAELQGNDAALAQVMGTAGISRAQANEQRQAEILKLQAELAGMGITV